MSVSFVGRKLPGSNAYVFRYVESQFLVGRREYLEEVPVAGMAQPRPRQAKIVFFEYLTNDIFSYYLSGIPIDCAERVRFGRVG